MSRVCTKCKEEKELSSFYKNRHSKDGYAWWCKSCCKEYTDKNREKINFRTKEWYKKNKQGTQEQYLSALRTDLKRKYSLTLEDYQSFHEFQDGKCAVCNINIFLYTKSNSRHSACVDHCHKTGKVRGLLCNHCNRALGMLKDDEEVIKNLLKYIERHNGK